MDYQDKSTKYYSNIRHDLIEFFGKKKNLKILEIGAAYGETLFYLKEKGIAKEAVAIELFEDKANKSNYKKIDRFIFGNINEIDLKEFDNYFDLILLPDVLEHIFDPKRTLDKMHALLKPDGEMVVSMPNIRHYSALLKIYIKGDFSYEENGLFDYTHLRFYCKKNMETLFECSNFKITKTESSLRNFKGKSISKILNSLTFNLFEEFFSTQYFFNLAKK
ncbi:Methyltransferase domain-containing protein [Flavobacteriaceae bacterium MAR_2010_188]|nr:Methyltransferase domain-containing protein [Flavobacteriaceae bacterium MAR_2010_188]